MDTQETGTQANATEATESTASGEPTQVESTQGGESAQTASDEKGTKGTEGLFDGMDAPTLHKSYKSLQGEYTKVQQAIKKLERFGGPDQITQWADYLSNNPRFAEWVKKEQMQKTIGVDESEMDEQTKKAYETVRKIADSATDAKVREILQNDIAPLAEAHKQLILEKHFSTMDEKYGKDWNEMRDLMSELSEDLSQRAQNNPTIDDIEDLYYKALRKSGKMEAFMTKQSQRKLAVKKAMSTEKPGSPAPSAPRTYKTIAEAFADAKRQQNMS